MTNQTLEAINSMDRAIWLLSAVEAALQGVIAKDDTTMNGIALVLGDALAEVETARDKLAGHEPGQGWGRGGRHA